jgi:uncharacterized membrane protein
MSQTLLNWMFLSMSFLHDLSICTYVGGAVAMEFILNPAQQTIPPAQAQIMGEKSSDRFLILVWVSLVVILITGVVRLQMKGLIGWDPLLNVPLTWDYSYGRTVITMFIIWIILAVNGSLITFLFRPRLKGKLGAGTSQSQATEDRNAKMQAATWIQNLSRVDLVLAVVALLLGASLLRGGVA